MINRLSKQMALIFALGAAGLMASGCETKPTEETTTQDVVADGTTAADSTGTDTASDADPSQDAGDVAVGPVCKSNADCKAVGACSISTCDAGHCTDTLAPNGLGCDDGEPCTTGESCSDGQCTGGQPVPDCKEKPPCTVTSDCKEGEYCAHEAACDGPGACTPKPAEPCPKPFVPVCGCDGITYGNECMAAEAGMSVATEGECPCTPVVCPDGQVGVDTNADLCADECVPKTDGCLKDSECQPGEYCHAPDGACGEKGKCEKKETGCTKQWKPVCGCDGETWPNACSASGAGVSVSHEGECKSECKSDLECAPGEYCHFADGACAAPGTCEMKADGCTKEWNPVCGCDGETWPSACAASASGVSIKNGGECKTCNALVCEEGTVPTDTDADGCDDLCTATCEAVCDCYDNAGIGLPNTCALKCATCDDYWTCEKNLCIPACGPVPDEAAACNAADPCTADADCAPGRYCHFADGACGGPGTCELKEIGCPKEWIPVCDCNGVTWPSPCVASSVGVSISTQGECSTCEPLVCAEGLGALDTNGDGCVDTCAAKCGGVCDCYDNKALAFQQTCALDCATCDEHWTCAGGYCVEACGPVPTATAACTAPGCATAIKCLAGTTAVDSDADGCFDTCVSTACTTNADCAAGSYCATDGCGSDGVCAAKPTACTKEYFAVCGCDDVTYQNKCMAAAAGATVAQNGACATACGGILGLLCPKGYVCDTDAGLCNGADLSGTCVAAPGSCPDEWDPVCGCDGTTYANDCDRLTAGVSLDHDGACGCTIAIDCIPGYSAVDSNADGCADSCDANCDAAPLCDTGTIPVDTNGDGCTDACEKPCAFVIDCAPGFAPVDKDGDGCDDGCKLTCSVAISCRGGTIPADTDGDGCDDTCVPKCNIAIKCLAGWVAVDTDGDGCNDSCVPMCATDIKCPPGTKPVDTDGDGCNDTCKKICVDIVDCAPGYVPVDSDGDGCNDACKPGCPFAIKCAAGYKPVDTDGDGCNDACKPICEVDIACAPGYAPEDTNGDGCNDACKPKCTITIKCGVGTIPVDTDGDGCPDECKSTCLVTISCGPGYQAVDTNGDGCDDACKSLCGVDLACPAGTYAADLDGDGCNDKCLPKCDVLIVCPKGQAPIDTNGDGCNDTCQSPCGPAVACLVGFAPVDTDSDGCFDACEPMCKLTIKCAAGYVATDTDGDGCPDVCKPVLCELAVVGQCKGFDYTTQCEKDCGTSAIFGDTDCDGKYDVCKKCPAGTHPVDLDGDGCEEACDCCKKLACPLGTAGVDTDQDGCPDACKPVPCDKAVSGQCKDYDYAGQCNPKGFDCTATAILGDANCDGKYDVCVKCPEGTHPVDADGDGCEEACDCCKPLLCPLGTKAVDTDGDSCADTCQVPCKVLLCIKPKLPVDTDGDGCADTCQTPCTIAIDCAPGYAPVDANGDGCIDGCKAIPCDGAKFGQCKGVKYDAAQCDPKGPDCGLQGILGDENCDGKYDICIACPDGTHPVDADGDGCEEACDCCKPLECAPGQVPVDVDFDGCPDDCKDAPCDKSVFGQCKGHDYVGQCNPTGFDCGPSGILGDTNCDGKYEVCLKCPAGTHPVDADGDGCEERCDCCAPLACEADTVAIDTDQDGCADLCKPLCAAILCPKGTIPVDTNDDGCADACKPFCPFAIKCAAGFEAVDTDGDGCNDTCKPLPCDGAITGQCKGVTYDPIVNKCDPKGFDCGAAGILGDKDCDGLYEVCIACPPGTHPADLDGDGCEEVCDCCKPLLCKLGTIPTDSDKDGCPDACVPAPCDQATYGQCKDFDYTLQCDPKGLDCGAYGILGDEDCDGQYDVCKECPDGTHPADLDGDGCEEVCDCCAKIVCPVGTVAVDSDGDGCNDACKDQPCASATFGQCKGFDYTKQCDPAGFDCGPFGILGDKDCDGLYDVCLVCPTGTHPVDVDGDGCEERCDCCKPIVCPAGTAAVDSDGDGCTDACKTLCKPFLCPKGMVAFDKDGDGCNDSCKPLCTIAIDCLPGYVAFDKDGDGCDDGCTPLPCDGAKNGQCKGFDYTSQCDPKGLDCGTFGILGDTNCDGKYDVCFACAPGTHPVDANGDGCEEACACCAPLDCAAGDEPADTDGDGCADTCLKAPCDKAEYGQCKGFEYAGQCNPKGFDCGPNAIFGDQNCDGQYDVCQLCPAGTHAVDRDGDGCEELCDCCPLILCPIGTQASDTDGNGCADKCLPKPCDAATWGQCKGFDYTTQCNKDGFDCGPSAIFGDKNCDGKYDVCQLCPPGTHAVDADGDGCEEMCDCCKPLLCGKGMLAVDTDQDGCPDKCKPLCLPVLCLPGNKPVDTDGDGCADTCVSICDVVLLCTDGEEPIDVDGDGCADKCVPQPCDGAKSGQCKGVTYDPVINKCNPDGFDCGSVGILGDKDCDGLYDICIACPAGTHPADLDGDGCEEVCDCCKLLVCPKNTTPVDTDKDGCPDTCKPICQLILCPVGQIAVDTDGDGCKDTCQVPCKDLLCNPDQVGLDENNDGCTDACECVPIVCKDGTTPVDSNDNGCFDTCAGCKPFECKPGFVPVDTNGDGCPDACQCAPFKCAAGYTAVDSDGDGCNDTCKKICLAIKCAADQVAVDSDGDGCNDLCKCKPLLCPTGTQPKDTDGNGCNDVCAPGCTIVVKCAADQVGVDENGDGCNDTCKCLGKECAAGQVPVDTNDNGCVDACKDCLAVLCQKDQVPADADGDGCKESCICAKILCPIGQKPVDTNGNGCGDTCKPACESKQCAADQVGSDSDGDGCVDTCTCKGLLCKLPKVATDTDKNGCNDTCACKPFACAFDQVASDSNGDGCNDVCKCGPMQKCPANYQATDTNGNTCLDTCLPLSCTANADCKVDTYMCVEPAGCKADALGKCAAKPTECPEPAPGTAAVCGCNGVTYKSTCFANLAGVNIAGNGACKSVPVQ